MKELVRINEQLEIFIWGEILLVKNINDEELLSMILCSLITILFFLFALMNSQILQKWHGTWSGYFSTLNW